MFQRLQIGDHVTDLPRIELKLRHCRMACHDAFGQGFGEILDRIFRVQRAEWRRDAKRTGTDLVDGMARRAVRGDECQPPLGIRFQGVGRDADQQREQH